jgi:hypothetical protein
MDALHIVADVIGSNVILIRSCNRNEENVGGTIVGVHFTGFGNTSVKYECVWWNGKERYCDLFDPMEVIGIGREAIKRLRRIVATPPLESLEHSD